MRAPGEIGHHGPWRSVVEVAAIVVAATVEVPVIAAVVLGDQDAPVAGGALDDDEGDGAVAAEHVGFAMHGVEQLGVVASRVVGVICGSVGEGDFV